MRRRTRLVVTASPCHSRRLPIDWPRANSRKAPSCQASSAQPSTRCPSGRCSRRPPPMPEEQAACDPTRSPSHVSSLDERSLRSGSSVRRRGETHQHHVRSRFLPLDTHAVAVARDMSCERHAIARGVQQLITPAFCSDAIASFRYVTQPAWTLKDHSAETNELARVGPELPRSVTPAGMVAFLAIESCVSTWRVMLLSLPPQPVRNHEATHAASTLRADFERAIRRHIICPRARALLGLSRWRGLRPAPPPRTTGGWRHRTGRPTA